MTRGAPEYSRPRGRKLSELQIGSPKRVFPLSAGFSVRLMGTVSSYSIHRSVATAMASAERRTPIHPNRRLPEVHKTNANRCKDELVSSDFKKTGKKHPTRVVSSIYETSRTPLISSIARSICSAPPSNTSTSSARIVVSGRGLISV